MISLYEKKNGIQKMALYGILILNLILSPFISAQSSTSFAPAIQGLVSYDNNVPIPYTEVIVFKWGTSDTLQKTVADHQGFFSFYNLPKVQDYKLWVDSTYHYGKNFPGQYWYLPYNITTNPQSPIILHDQAVFTVKIKMTENPAQHSNPLQYYIGAIEGKITNEFGPVMRNVHVIATDAFDSSVTFDEGFSDDSGHFVLFEIPAEAPLHLEFRPASGSDIPRQFWAENHTTLKPVHEIVVPRFDTYHREYILEKNPDTGNVDTTFATLAVTLFDENNSVVLNECRLSFLSNTGNVDYFRDTNSSDTTMVISRLREGNHSILFEVAGFPPQYYNPSGNTSYNDYSIWLSRGVNPPLNINLVQSFDKGKISGTVKNGIGVPIPGVKICVIDTSYFHWGPWINAYDFHSEYSILTDKSGNYEISNVRYGTYLVLATTDNRDFIPVFYPRTQIFNKAEKFEITTANSAHKVNFELLRGVKIEGFIKDDAGAALRNIRASLYEDWKDTVPARSFFYETLTDLGGKFTFRGIPSGKWHMHAHDDSGFYMVIDYEYDDLVTQGFDVTIDKPITMKAGGALCGNYKIAMSDSNDQHDIGQIYIYPSDTSLSQDKDDYWRHIRIGIRRTERPNEYASEAIPAGEWKMVICPNPPHDQYDIWQNKDFIPFMRWSFIDSALTFMSTKPLTITPFKKRERFLNFPGNGFIVKGKIASEGNDHFGPNSATGGYGKHFSVRVYIKDAGHFVQVSESYDLSDNKYIISGLIDGQQYFFNSHAEEYPEQWWIDLPDSASSIADSAKPYTFSTANFTMPDIFLQKKPQGYQGHHEGPPPLKNITIKPSGLNTFTVKWSKPPPKDDVVEYKIFRIRNAQQNFFTLVNNGEHWDIDTTVISEDELFKLVDSIIVTDTFLVDNTVDPFIDYMYIVFGINSKGEEGGALPGEIHISHYFTKIDYNTYTFTSTIKPNAWHMTGICGLDSIIVANTGGNIQVFHWDEKADSTKLYSHYQPTEVINWGQGVWVYTYNPIDLAMTKSAFARLVQNKNNINIKLQKGWNQVSSPFPYEVSPKWLDSLDTWEWNPAINGYQEPQTFKPWKAYWVHSSADVDKSISPIPAVPYKKVKRRLKRSAGWELKVSLRGETSSDPDNFIGTLPVQLSKSMSNSAAEPPQAFDFPQLYFVNDKEKLSKLYLFANRIPEKKLEWVLAISPSSDEMQIEISNLAHVPEEVGLFLIDKSGFYDLRKNNVITVEAHESIYNGLILATANPVDMALYSGTYMLKQNYPNPFRSATTIEFTIPYSWDSNGKLSSNRQSVSLSVYNVSGQLVSTLFSGAVKVGHHKTVWDGRSNSGRSLPSGMYIARFEGALFTKSMRLFKVK